MRKIRAKKSNYNQSKAEQGLGSGIKKVCMAIALLVVLALAFILVETMNSKKITITNNTSRKIDTMHIYFGTEEESLSEDLANISLEAGETFKSNFSSIHFDEAEAMLISNVIFDGEELIIIDEGNFTGVFSGNIKVEFREEEGDIYMDAKASTGLLGKANFDETFILDFENQDWDYVD